jgi:hypothetical protein
LRNDGILNTGLSSASSRRYNEREQRKAEIKGQKKQLLTPSAEMIKAEIRKLRDEIDQEAKSVIDPKSTDAEIRAIVTGAKWADNKLMSLEMRLLNLLGRRVIDEQ